MSTHRLSMLALFDTSQSLGKKVICRCGCGKRVTIKTSRRHVLAQLKSRARVRIVREMEELRAFAGDRIPVLQPIQSSTVSNTPTTSQSSTQNTIPFMEEDTIPFMEEDTFPQDLEISHANPSPPDDIPPIPTQILNAFRARWTETLRPALLLAEAQHEQESELEERLALHDQLNVENIDGRNYGISMLDIDGYDGEQEEEDDEDQDQ
ncbi:hypothetical protein CVT24_013412, partial [Panaeolus cyanescens]